MHSQKVEGIILSRVNYGETDRILTIFTREQGKILVIAKSVRKSNSKRSALLDQFNIIKATIYPGKNLDTLAEVLLLDSFSQWKHHLGRVMVAYQLVEMVSKNTAEKEPHEDLYNQLFVFLKSIGSMGEDWQKYLEKMLLEFAITLGYWPKEKEFTGDIYALVADISSPLKSKKLFEKLANS